MGGVSGDDIVNVLAGSIGLAAALDLIGAPRLLIDRTIVRADMSGKPRIRSKSTKGG